MKQKKSTKRFIKNNLKDAIEKRREKQKNRKVVTKRKPKQIHHDEEASNKYEEQEDDLDVMQESSDEDSSGDDLENVELSSEDEAPTNHKLELDRLKEKDPEFHKYLQENDSSLLAFDESDDESDEEMENGDESPEDDSADESEEEEVKVKPAQKKHAQAGIKLTQTLIQQWSSQVKANSLKSTKKMLMAFKSAVGKEDEPMYTIDDARIFNMLAVEVLHVNQALLYNLPKRPMSSNPKWSKIRPMIKSYLNSLLSLLEQTQDENLLNIMLRKTREIVPAMADFVKISKNMVARLVRVMSEKPEKTRMLAVLVIGDLAGQTHDKPSPLYTPILKQMIQAYKSLPYNHHNREMHDFVKLAVIQVSKIGPAQVYQVAFQQLRELAMKLRAKTDLITWNHLKQLELWAELIAVHMHDSKDTPLAMLAYPLIQITLASFRNAADLVPYNVHLLSILVGLSNQVFIPLTNQFIDIFGKLSSTKPVKTTGKKQSMHFLLKSSNLHQHQSEMMSHLTSLACRYFTQLSTSHAFPELIIPFAYHLKKIKAKSLGTLIDKLKESAKFIEQARANTSPIEPIRFQFETSDTPIGKYYNNLKAVKDRLAAPLAKPKPASSQQSASEKQPASNKQKKRKGDHKQVKPGKKPRVVVEEDGDQEDVVAEFDLNQWK